MLILEAQFTNAASMPGYGLANFLPIWPSCSALTASDPRYAYIMQPPGMRAGGWVFLREIYRLQWRFLKVWEDDNQINPTGQREFQLSPEALQQVFGLVEHLHVPTSFWA